LFLIIRAPLVDLPGELVTSPLSGGVQRGDVLIRWYRAMVSDPGAGTLGQLVETSPVVICAVTVVAVVVVCGGSGERAEELAARSLDAAVNGVVLDIGRGGSE
jgi:hypothetical protein